MRRIAALASLAGLLALTATPASGSPAFRVTPPGDMYRLAKPLAAAASTPVGDTYGGATSSGDPIVVQTTRSGKAVARIADQWFAQCTSGKILPFAAELPAAGKNAPTIDRKGRFDATTQGTLDLGTSTGNIVEEVRGRLGQKRSSGVLAAHVDVLDKQTQQKVDACDVSVTWVFGRQDLIYGGATAQQAPVVLELSPKHKKVAAFLIGWGANCSDGGVLFGPISGAFGSFPLSKHHAFGRSFSETLPSGTGGTGKFDYALHGKVGASRASGRFGVHMIQRDSFGGTVATCSLASEPWKATG